MALGSITRSYKVQRADQISVQQLVANVLTTVPLLELELIPAVNVQAESYVVQQFQIGGADAVWGLANLTVGGTVTIQITAP